MKRLALATDFSERSDRALRRAVLLSRRSGAVIDLVHVIDDDRPRRIVEQEKHEAWLLLTELAGSLKSVDGVASTIRIELADPFAGILKSVDDPAPDMLVIGPHRRQILRDTFIGTTAERTIRAAACPVLMANGPPFGDYGHIMLTTDLSEGSRKALKRLVRLDDYFSGRRSILNVFDAPALRLAMSSFVAERDREDYLDGLRADARRDLVVFATEIGAASAECLVRHEAAAPAVEILEEAVARRADLLVVSTQSRATLARAVLGSVAERILASASLDVLVLPPPERESEE